MEVYRYDKVKSDEELLNMESFEQFQDIVCNDADVKLIKSFSNDS